MNGDSQSIDRETETQSKLQLAQWPLIVVDPLRAHHVAVSVPFLCRLLVTDKLAAELQSEPLLHRNLRCGSSLRAIGNVQRFRIDNGSLNVDQSLVSVVDMFSTQISETRSMCTPMRRMGGD